VYSLKDNPNEFQLALTSKVADIIHAINVTISREVDVKHSLTLIEDLFNEKSVRLRRGGILLSGGLQDALRHWGGAAVVSNPEELEQLLRDGRRGFGESAK
jgi:hypothetical protein